MNTGRPRNRRPSKVGQPRTHRDPEGAPDISKAAVFPLDPVIEWVRWHYFPGGVPMTDTEITRAIGYADRTFARIRARGALTARQADEMAVSMGVHPFELWPDLWGRDNLDALVGEVV